MSDSKMEAPRAYDATVPIAVQAQESKRRKRRIMKIAVYFMFGIIAIGVFAIWLFHKDSVESLRFDTDFIFTVKLRSLEVKNSEGDGILYGDMGRNLLATPYDHCWDETFDNYEENCLYWRKMARLRVARDDNSTSSCYTLKWEGLANDFQAEDCFYMQRYDWFGYITNFTPVWPVTGVYLNGQDYYPTYPERQTNNLVPIWFGSQGISIFVDSSYPFSTSWNVTDKRQLCITSSRKAKGGPQPTDLIEYTICQGESLEDIYRVTQKHRLEKDVEFFAGAKQQSEILAKPILSVGSQEDVTEVLFQHSSNFSDFSLVEIHDGWEKEFGDLEIDPDALPDLENLISQASAQDCHLIMPLSTFFSYKSKLFEEAVGKHFFVQDSLNLATRMIRWRGQEGAVLDVSNPLAARWFLGHVRQLISQYGITAIKMLHIDIPLDCSFDIPNITYLDYTRLFYREMSSLNISLVQDLATGFIPLPVQTPVAMPFLGSDGATCMNTTVPQALILGMSGFPLLVANVAQPSNGSISEEQFKLWLRLAIFFPVLKIPAIPLLNEMSVQVFMSKVLTLRYQSLLPYMSQVQADESDSPIIRPMWWIAPHDDKALLINDQFVIGNDLIVAPVLCEDSESRQVYFPKGTWQLPQGKKIEGPTTKEFQINSEGTILYFWRQTEKSSGDENGVVRENYM